MTSRAIYASLYNADRFDVTLNPMPFPMSTRGGTEIPHGLKIDIVNFNFFHIILVRRVFLHVTLLPPGIECHIFIDPFNFKLAGTTIFSLTGLEGDSKKAAKAKKAEAVKARAEAEAIAKAKYDAGLTLGNLRNEKVAEWNTVCGEQECMTCARQVENTGLMMLGCGTQVGRCRLTVSKASLVSELEATI